jgi:acetyl/propionyl-CoA carboxylase alpha subunit
MKMNARIQVEHGITEEMTDIDLGKWQLFRTAGEKFTIDQRALKLANMPLSAKLTRKIQLGILLLARAN